MTRHTLTTIVGSATFTIVTSSTSMNVPTQKANSRPVAFGWQWIVSARWTSP
jgi:hypothetical protein